MEINITGCVDCPCCDMLDMAPGYACNLVDSQKVGYIKVNKFHMPDTPDWCPLLKENMTLKKVPSDKELTQFASAVSLASIHPSN